MAGRKIPASEYVPYVAKDHEQTKGKSREVGPVIKKIGDDTVFEGRIVEKTDQFMKTHLTKVAIQVSDFRVVTRLDALNDTDSVISQKAMLPCWTPQYYPSSTFALKKDEQILPLKAVHPWPEYSSLGDGEVMVTIELCSGCEHHQLYTHHKEEHYREVADAVENALAGAAARIGVEQFSVVLKPVNHATELNNPEDASTFHQFRPKSDIVDTVSTSLRIGAFEVQVSLLFVPGIVLYSANCINVRLRLRAVAVTLSAT
jgi:hypothetical protein